MNGAETAWPIIVSIGEIAGLLSIGATGRFFRYIEERDIDRWSRLVLDFLYPAFIFSSITAGFRTERLGELWSLPLIGLGISAGGLILGLGLKYGLRARDAATKRTFLYFCAVNNYAYLPIVIVQNLWGGQTMVANLFYLMLGLTIATWTWGVGVLGSTNVRQTARNLFTPTLVATVAAVAVALCGLGKHIPAAVNHILSNAGSASVPMMVVLAGASLFRPAAWRITWPVVYIALVRLLVLPACAVAVLRLLPLSHDIFLLSAIVALMPLGVSSVIYTRIFGGEPDYAASASLVTTAAAIVTVPFALWFLSGL